MKYLLSLWMLFSTMVWADIDDGDGTSGYEQIVSELRADENVVETPDPWDTVGIYGGLGLTTSYLKATLPNSQKVSGLLKGLEGHFGIDLFTRNLRAEGAFRAYAQESLDSRTRASMKEFELRTVFIPAPYSANLLRLGAGLTARYIDIRSESEAGSSEINTQTPAAVFIFGLQRKFGHNVAFGPDISYRSNLTDEYINPTWDLCLKLDANF